MAKYRCGLCHKIVDRPERRADRYLETCSKTDQLATMRKVVEKKSNIRRDAGEE